MMTSNSLLHKLQMRLRYIRTQGTALEDVVVPVFLLVCFACLVRMVEDYWSGDTVGVVLCLVWIITYGYVAVDALRNGKLNLFLTETLCVMSAMLICLQDTLAYGQLDMWLWLLLVVDVSFLCGARVGVRVFVVLLSTCYIIAKTIEDAEDYGLYWLGDERNMTYVSRLQGRGPKWAINCLSVRLCIFLSNVALVFGLGQHALSLHNITKSVCSALSVLDLESAESALLRYPAQTETRMALAHLTANLRGFKPYLPDIAMAGGDVSLPLETKEIGLLKIVLSSSSNEKEFLSAVFNAAQTWNATIHSFDARACLAVFGTERTKHITGCWGVGPLVIKITQQGSNMYSLRAYNVPFGQREVRLQDGRYEDIPVSPVVMTDSWSAPLGKGRVWLSKSTGESIKACFENVAGQNNGEVVNLHRSAAICTLASACALAIKDSLSAKSQARTAVVWGECQVGVLGTAERLGMSITGPGVELCNDILDIAEAIDERLLCSHATLTWLQKVYNMTEVHAGPVHDGPLFSITDGTMMAKLQRVEAGLLEELPTNRELPLEDLGPTENWEELGKGRAGRVWKVWYKNLQQHVAVKELKADGLCKDRISFVQELMHMNDMRMSSVVNFYGYSRGTDSSIFIIMELCEASAIQLAYRPVEDAQRQRLAVTMGLEVARALSYIHSKGKVHMDVACRNVLVTEDGKYKLTDFGMMKCEGEPSAMISYPWAPPEAMTDRRKATSFYDVWSFGMLMYEVLASGPPYGRPMTIPRVKELISSGVLPVTPECVGRSAECKGLWERIVLPCLQQDPLSRPTMRQLTSILSQCSLPPSPEGSFSTQRSMMGIPRADTTATTSSYETGNVYGELPEGFQVYTSNPLQLIDSPHHAVTINTEEGERS
eukprot:TRINITY_DN34293_c0_g1_i1.p1 TRINITY_DN34293_c0_g1~~TRINITY_DN34293_c0_g1_i1.p1  ORF type:complete len:902 (+),score=204.84 TRINITY_DN34293_c0_g1_i1:50-2707(+)